MSSHATAQIRNIALVGHGHAGKTSLTEALLFAAKAIPKMGGVDQGTATTDFGEDEHARKLSIRVGLAHYSAGPLKVNLLDTPGYGNFMHEARVGLSVADCALVVVDGGHGVEVQTEKVWAYADEFSLPRLVVLNKMDRENATFDRALKGVQDRWGRKAVPVQVPIGSEHDFCGVVDLVSQAAWKWKGDGSIAAGSVAVPGELAALVDKQRATLVEMVAECDEKLMEKFLEAGELTEGDLRAGLALAVRTGQLYPVYCASALRGIGIQPISEALTQLVPPPDARPPRIGSDGTTERRCSDDQPFSAQVFKTLHDPFAGRLSYFRVQSGVVKSDGTCLNATRGTEERCANLYVVQGKELIKTTDLHAGDIGCLAKLKDTLTGDTICDKTNPITYEPLSVPEPMMSFAITGKNQGEEDKMTAALHKICEEDAVLRFRLDPQTHELVLSGTGDGHVEAVAQRLKDRYKLEVVLHPPRVPYKETITKATSGAYRHRKQTGGAGQFAEVHMEVKPLPRGGGFEYDTKRVHGGAISNNFFPSIEKGIHSVLGRGPLTGCQVVDVRCEVYDGKMHAVDSKDVAFQSAGRQLMRQLVLEAHPILLEPVMKVAVTVPEECMGDVMGDLSGRRGRVQGMEMEGRKQVIRAQVPLAEMLTYQAQLKSMSGGRGDFHMELDHYAPVPTQIQEKLILDAKKHVGEDTED